MKNELKLSKKSRKRGDIKEIAIATEMEVNIIKNSCSSALSYLFVLTL